MRGRSYLVTGGASGIGLATARSLLVQGACVVVADRDGGRLDAAVVDLKKEGGSVGSVMLDVSDPSAVEEAIAGIEAIDGLVNAAGVLQMGTIADVTPEDWDRVLGVNLKGTFLTCKAVIPRLVARGGGAIVNLASISGRTKSIYSAPSYVASKGGVIGLTMTLAAQHATSGVRVNCVAPGVVETPMTSVYTEEQWRAIVDQIPMRRIGTADEIAQVIVALLSDRFSYVTGQTINVNGGQFTL
jgi:3-oxoacyl-[acyl-carrier protein] reductase